MADSEHSKVDRHYTDGMGEAARKDFDEILALNEVFDEKFDKKKIVLGLSVAGLLGAAGALALQRLHKKDNE
jgi:hypothetical protein